MSNFNLTKIISYLLKIIFIIGIILIPFIPTMYNLIGTENLKVFADQTILYQITLYICYLFSLSIIYILILMFSSIDKNGPFIMSTSKYLKIISLFFIILSIIIFIKILFIPTIISIAICVITFIVSLCFYTLSEIFKEAINHKKELDYTI